MLNRDLRKVAFVIFKPDVLQQNLEQSVWAFFERRQIRLLAQKVDFITRDKRKQLYIDFHVSSKTNWDLGTEFYELGPALFLIVYGDFPSTYNSLGEYISSELKGSFVPEEAKSGTVRGDFNSINPVFNLIHSSDNTNKALREIQIFFTRDELFSLIRDMRLKKLDLSFKDELQPKEYNFYSLFYKVKLELLKSVKIDGTLDEQHHDYLKTSLEALERITSRKEKRQKLLHLLTEEHQKYTQAGEYPRSLLRELSEYWRFPQLNYEKLFEQLYKGGVTLNSWERYLLKSTMFYITFKLE
ncbi:nucleoside-diphosphate kinase [Brevibacillus centrosporus]|uniref:nucleoside-diphosphate kinase n=1 Tax=Brevibacillus centrosporus TaxID=54910 RepID=A0A1I4E2V1_9BACL|nr:nucleoside-diphosphate kinase [Brevibacillus centrosporus]SFL00095.1 nucleoside diphosphate kinase [Brevibacillus centrosporus]